jgi:hypothetical protein
MIGSIYSVVLVIFSIEICKAKLSDSMYKEIYKQGFLRFSLSHTKPKIRFTMGICMDPTIDELVKMLRQARTPLEMPTNFTDSQKVTDNSGCKNSKFITMEDSAMCPYKLVTTKKSDRFPRLVVHAKCTCNYCRGLDRKKIKSEEIGVTFYCEPVYENFSVLVRGKCGINGIYEWKKVIESVPKFCDCKSERIVESK